MIARKLRNFLLGRPMVRPWALSVPILVLLLCLPMLRPLRHPDPREVSDGETARLATIQALAERQTLALYQPLSELPVRRLIVTGDTLFSDQPPVMAMLLAAPYWIMYRLGLRMDENPNLVAYLLTLLGVTMPVALAGGLVYRMGRLFELKRPVRAALGAAVVGGSGLLSYAVVLNAHAPAAVLVLAAGACLIHAALSPGPASGGGWVLGAGFCASLAAVLEPTAALFAILFAAVPLAMRWRPLHRVRALLAYGIGLVPPLFLHAALMVSGDFPVTGDLLPGYLHPELALTAQTNLPPGLGIAPMAEMDADEPPVQETGESLLLSVWQPLARLTGAFLGTHGLLSHYPVLIMGFLGVAAIMHRHWPAATKVLAAGTVAGAAAAVLILCLLSDAGPGSMYAARWFVVFMPLMLFWAGAWLRKQHRPMSWALAGLLLIFSLAVAVLGMTDPLPRQGYDGYTPAQALGQLLDGEQRIPADEPARPLLARINRGNPLP